MRNLDLLVLLRTIEWAGNRTERVCPLCRRLDYEDHRKDCALATAIRDLKAITRDPG